MITMHVSMHTNLKIMLSCEKKQFCAAVVESIDDRHIVIHYVMYTDVKMHQVSSITIMIYCRCMSISIIYASEIVTSACSDNIQNQNHQNRETGHI